MLMRLFLIIVFSSFILLPLSSGAAEWLLEPSVKVKAQYNDNLYLTTIKSNEEAVTSGSFNPNIAFKIDDEAEHFSAVLDLDLTRYKNKSDLKRDEGALDLSWNKKSERGQLSVSGSYNQNSSLNQNLEFSGIADQEVIRNIASITPSWTYSFTEKNLIQVMYSFSEAKYDEPGFSVPGFEKVKIVNFENYRRQTYTAVIKHFVTESDSVSLSVTLTDHKGEGNGLTFGTYGPFNAFYTAYGKRTEYVNKAYQIGYTHTFTETHKLDFSAGVNNTDTEELAQLHRIVFVPPSDNLEPWAIISKSQRNGNKYNIVYEYAGEVEKVSFSMSQDFTSVSTGVLVDQKRLVFGYSIENSERLRFGLKLTALKDETVVEVAGVAQDNDARVNFSPFLYWNMSKDWALSVRYNYSRLERDTEQTNADSNAIFFGINWRWPKMVSTY